MCGMTLERAAWAIVILACLITAVVLVARGFLGYAAVSTAVGLAAATNLHRDRDPGDQNAP
jgi:hypothetical protein